MTQPRDYEDDDGRVIVNMDVEGMRWHDRRSSSGSNRPDFPIVRRGGLRGDELTESETRRYTFYALLAGLVVVLGVRRHLGAAGPVHDPGLVQVRVRPEKRISVRGRIPPGKI